MNKEYNISDFDNLVSITRKTIDKNTSSKNVCNRKYKYLILLFIITCILFTEKSLFFSLFSNNIVPNHIDHFQKYHNFSPNISLFYSISQNKNIEVVLKNRDKENATLGQQYFYLFFNIPQRLENNISKEDIIKFYFHELKFVSDPNYLTEEEINLIYFKWLNHLKTTIPKLIIEDGS